MNIRRFETYPRLATALTVTFLLCGLLLALVLLARVSNHIVSFENELQSELVSRGAEGIRHVVTLSVEREWRSLKAITSSADFGNPEETRHFVDAARQVGNNISWAAFADLNGKIVAGSDRIGEGTDVSQRTWFKNGLTSGRLYSRRTVPGADSPEFLQMTQPVRDESGQVIGVMTYFLDMEWGKMLISHASAVLNVDAILVDSKNNILIDARSASMQPSSGGPAGQTELEALLRHPSNETALVDGMVVSSVQAITSQNLPYFGGRLIVYVPSSMAEGTVASFTKQMVFWIIGALVVATLVPIVLVAHFVRPIERLASTANNLADGVYDYPEERCFTREAAIFSASLARLQTRLKRGGNVKSAVDVNHCEAPLRNRMSPLNAPLLNRRSRLSGLFGFDPGPQAVENDKL